ncbi:hypothetical protein D3C76_1448800 [compost metagenome]
MFIQPAAYLMQSRFLGWIQLLVRYVMQQRRKLAYEQIRLLLASDGQSRIPDSMNMPPVVAASVSAVHVLHELLGLFNDLLPPVHPHRSFPISSS